MSRGLRHVLLIHDVLLARSPRTARSSSTVSSVSTATTSRIRCRSFGHKPAAARSTTTTTAALACCRGVPVRPHLDRCSDTRGALFSTAASSGRDLVPLPADVRPKTIRSESTFRASAATAGTTIRATDHTRLARSSSPPSEVPPCTSRLRRLRTTATASSRAVLRRATPCSAGRASTIPGNQMILTHLITVVEVDTPSPAATTTAGTPSTTTENQYRPRGVRPRPGERPGRRDHMRLRRRIGDDKRGHRGRVVRPVGESLLPLSSDP